ncbi:MAG: hypothetical protein JW760_08110 [Spirochaetales bacterium]|nr:hypothetical protein [Spirochaetales bacterium]
MIILLIFLIVFIPAVILSLLAVRAVGQEEMVQRRRLEDSLLLELDQTNTIIVFTLEQILEELRETLPDFSSRDPGADLKTWSGENSLVGNPYLLNPDGSILYPDIADRTISEEERDEVNLFYWRYLNLFSNKESIPIYRNIAGEFTEEILASENAPASSAAPAPQLSESRKSVAEEAPFSDSPAQAVQAYPAAPPEAEDSAESRAKSALGVFQADAEVQERIYEKAEEEGIRPLQRNVSPQVTVTPRKETAQTVVRSVYIESTRSFEEIVREGEYGLIPRLFDSAFILLYWERRGDRIAGCELDMTEVTGRLREAVQVPVNSVRYITILDHLGYPVIPQGELSRDQWRQPFVAKEISELLPYWETAILLRSQEDFEKQIETSRYYLSFLIFFLCLLIFIGMTALYQFSSARLKEVQQRVGFVTNVSHELKTPLTSIRMYSEMLAEGLGTNPEKIRKYSSYIASESRRLSRLISNILVFAKLEKGSAPPNMEIVDINEVIRDLIETLREEMASEGYNPILLLAEGELSIRGNRESLIQVLLNLLSNAQKYNGTEKYIEIRSASDRGEVSVEIIDRGIGIPPKYRKKIFKEFYRIDNSITSETKGTGLGLAIARRIMRQHGGDLTFEQRDPDKPEEGSIFTMIFPALRENGN